MSDDEEDSALDNDLALPVGYQLEDYDILGVLGSGGFGITYLAFDRRLDSRVALKEYLPFDFAVRSSGSKVVARTRNDLANFNWGLDSFLKEARTLRRLDHPNVVRVLRHFDALGTGFIVMEYVEGQTLESATQDSPWGEEELRPVLDQLLDACETIHEAGLLHRDIKPANIILRASGRPVLIDFGAARQASTARSRSMTAVVSPGFGPIEQYSATAQQGPCSDIYALAATCYFAMTGHEPPDATDRVLNDTMAPLAKDPAVRGSVAFRKTLDHGMAVQPQARPQTIADWRAEFPVVRPEPAIPSDGARKRGLTVPLIAGGAALALLAGGYAIHREMTPTGGGGGVTSTGTAGPSASVDFAGAQRIAALAPTQIDPDTSDALWSDAAVLPGKGFLAATTAGVGIANETATLYLISDIDRPPARWTGPLGSRGSATVAAPDGSVALIGGEKQGQGFVTAVKPGTDTMDELWTHPLGAGRVYGLAYGNATILAALSPDTGDSSIQFLGPDGTPKGAYTPQMPGVRTVLHKVVALPDGGIATGWIEPAGGGNPTLFVARFGADGTERWHALGPAAEGGAHGNALSILDGQIHVVGWRRISVNGAFLFQGVIDTFDMDGKLLGEKIVRQNGSLLLRGVQEAGGGNLFVSGTAFDDLMTDHGGAWWVAEVDGEGRVLDTDTSRVASRHQIAEALALDAQRGLFALGFSASGDRADAAPTAAIYTVGKK